MPENFSGLFELYGIVSLKRITYEASPSQSWKTAFVSFDFCQQAKQFPDYAPCFQPTAGTLITEYIDYHTHNGYDNTRIGYDNEREDD
jgi:hypothetical protein